ncbi:Peptidyl-prolyl isomerase cwc27 [Eufriesea mexicana]|uniref:Peptidyl-prolyl isomerase cwc27 n=1 Tax=Eufriesea mexicana TaxID=516756 RepID=A0A310S5D0_9HYME|nr:Peptidyl-prolyl isomerase cwc27 [Eufriesea mexicana]
MVGRVAGDLNRSNVDVKSLTVVGHILGWRLGVNALLTTSGDVIVNSTPDLQNKHIIFSRVTGESVYSMLKLEEALVDENDKPLYPPRLIKIIILNNLFSDIIPSIIVQEKAKEDEEESVILNKKFTGNGKSAHDHLTDPKLISQPAVEPPGLANKKRKEGRNSNWESDDAEKLKKN